MGPAEGPIATFEPAKKSRCPVRGERDVGHTDLLLCSFARPA
jgi:hypothetical protein